MKRALLMLMAGALAGTVQAQHASRSILFGQSVNPTNQEAGSVIYHQPSSTPVAHKGSAAAARGTIGGSRWYDYADEIFQTNSAVNYAQSAIGIWNDTTSIWGYSGATPYAGNAFTSIGLGFDGFASVWNDTALFPGVIALDETKNYSIDSVKIAAFYERNYATTAKRAVVDTLILTFVNGDGASTADLAFGLAYGGTLASDYGVSSVDFLNLYHDSLNNRAGKSTGALAIPWPMPTAVPSTQVFKFALTGADTVTTGTFGMTGSMNIAYPRPGHVPADLPINFAVPAGKYAAMTVTFKSGDATYPAYPARDTVRYSGTAGAQKYNTYIPLLGYNETVSGSGVPTWAPYSTDDWTAGYYKKEGPGGNGGIYSPHWGWTTSSGASTLQYPMISYHVNCPTCVLTGSASLTVSNTHAVNKVQVYPNPASNELNVSFTTSKASNVKVALINALGQTVATQNLSNTNSGTAVFNTTSLASGVYMYVVEADGTRSTGRVSIAH